MMAHHMDQLMVVVTISISVTQVVEITKHVHVIQTHTVTTIVPITGKVTQKTPFYQENIAVGMCKN